MFYGELWPMSVSGPIYPGSIEKKMVNIDGFIFFADSFEYSVERDTQKTGNKKVSTGNTSTQVPSFQITSIEVTMEFEFQGLFVAQEIRNIMYEDGNKPETLEVEVKSIRQNDSWTFSGAMITASNSAPKTENSTYTVNVDMIATDFEKNTSHAV